MKRSLLYSMLGASALILTSCGGGDGSTPAPTPTPSPSSSPTPSPTPTPTYQTLAELTGDQTFQTAGVTYEITGPNPLTNPSAQGFGGGSVIDFIESTGVIRFTAPGGTPTVDVFEADGIQQSPGVTQWRIPVGSATPVDVITLFQGQTTYSFLGIWSHAEGGTITFRLGTGGVPTQDNDYPSGSVAYAVAVGGSVNDGSGAKQVDTTRSTGTLTLDFATGMGSMSVELFDTSGNSLGILTAAVAFTRSTNGFSGEVTFGGNTGVMSGAFFGPQAVEIGFGMALANGSNTYVGLGGGTAP